MKVFLNQHTKIWGLNATNGICAKWSQTATRHLSQQCHYKNYRVILYEWHLPWSRYTLCQKQIFDLLFKNSFPILAEVSRVSSSRTPLWSFSYCRCRIHPCFSIVHWQWKKLCFLTDFIFPLQFSKEKEVLLAKHCCQSDITVGLITWKLKVFLFSID